MAKNFHAGAKPFTSPRRAGASSRAAVAASATTVSSTARYSRNRRRPAAVSREELPHSEPAAHRRGRGRELTARERDGAEPRGQVPPADPEDRGGQEAAGREHAEAEDHLPEAREHPGGLRGRCEQHEREEPARRGGGHELLHGRPQHLLGEGAVDAARAGDHLEADETGADERRPRPERQIGGDVARRVVEERRLGPGGDEGEEPGGRERRGAVATEDDTARDLTADRRDLRERLVQVPEHESVALHHKVPCIAGRVKPRRTIWRPAWTSSYRLFAFFQSARKRSSPASVSGCFTSCWRTAKGQVAMCAPICAARITWRGLRTLATRTSAG